LKNVLVIFKTHFDLGFTDFADNIRCKYIESFIPKAISTAEELRMRGGASRFVWSMGSWLIDEFLRCADSENTKALERAIENGDISWHALPFTTHTELMDEELFRYGLSLSENLDSRFGVKTLAGKMTDVPGHTKAMIPMLCEAGVELLHIGVNSASPVPDVPPIFQWMADSGESVLVIYSGGYGKPVLLGDTGCLLYFAHTGDNQPPQSADGIEALFERLRSEYAGADITACNLNTVAELLRPEKEKFPIIQDEIGDTWIHGIQTDPGKVSMFRSLLRFRSTLTDSKVRGEVNRHLLCTPEHTWGLDVKTWLNDQEHYGRKDFETVRKTERFQTLERSWKEQRDYLNKALESLPEPERAKARQKMDEYRRPMCDCGDMQALDISETHEVCGWQIQFGPCGEIKKLQKGDVVLADHDHLLAYWIYEQFSPADYERFLEQYIRNKSDWALKDFAKPGMETAVTAYYKASPLLQSLRRQGNIIVALLNFPTEAVQSFGCPAKVETMIYPEGDSFVIDAAWRGKSANRVAEALWLGMNPRSKGLLVRKLGRWVNPLNVRKNGNRRLFGTDWGVKYDNVSIQSLDTALLAFDEPSLLSFTHEKAAAESGVVFNLYNNVWGTNFPMWYDEDARFRFLLSVIE